VTPREAAIVSAYTGYMLGSFSEMHKFIEEILDRPVFTHELANKALYDTIREKAKPYFVVVQIDP